jgi:light-regulated signal transduction histidine kinase (bacteriophytochrome)
VGLEDVASGVLAVALSRQRRGLMVWFRPQTLQTVQWAGNPHDKPAVPGPHGPRLSPRASFEMFCESVRGRSLPWARCWAWRGTAARSCGRSGGAAAKARPPPRSRRRR